MESRRMGGPLLALGIILVLAAGAVCWVVFRASNRVMPVAPVGVAHPPSGVQPPPAVPQIDWEKRCGELQAKLDAAELKRAAAEEFLQIARKATDPALRDELVKLRLAKDGIESRLQKAQAELAASAKALTAANEATAAARLDASAATQAAKLSSNRAAELETARAAAEKTAADLTKRVKDLEAGLATAQADRAAAEKKAEDAVKRLQELQAPSAPPMPAQ